jgi:hypothetical protein
VADLYKPLEIKNNNFEINNNFYGNIKIGNPGSITNSIINNSMSYLNISLYDPTDYNKLICFLVTPRVMKIKNIPYLFQVSPVIKNASENYLLKWSDIKSFAESGCIDIAKVNHCLGNELSLIIRYNDNTSSVEIKTSSVEECKNYVNGINFLNKNVKKGK